MADSSYNRQHLATAAAGHINGAGTSLQAFGCGLTRIGTGHYGMLLGASDGVVEDDSFTRVQAKGTNPRTVSVVDTSNVLKTIFTFDGTSGALADTDIEVALFKSVTK